MGDDWDITLIGLNHTTYNAAPSCTYTVTMTALSVPVETERRGTWTVMEFLSTGSKERRSQMSAMRSAASFSTLFRKSETTARPG